MRVFYLITEFDIGGAERCLWELARHMKRRGHAVHACALSGRGPVGEWLRHEGVAVHHLDMRGKTDAAAVVRLAALLRASRCDVLHSFLFHANFVGRWAALLARVPVCVCSVRVAEKRRRSHLVLDRLTLSLVDAEVAVSRSVADFMRREAHVPNRKIVVIPNGVDVDRFAGTPKGLLRKELGLAHGVPIVGFIGRLEAQKGLDALLRAFPTVIRAVPDAKLVVVGDGRAADALRALASEMIPSNGVFFLGWRADIAEVLKDFDVLAAPSRWEGMSNVILEGLAAGVPVVASRVEGMEEVLGDNAFGEVLDATEELPERLLRLLHDPQRRKELARKGPQHVQAAFSVEVMVDRYERLYASRLAGRRR